MVEAVLAPTLGVRIEAPAAAWLVDTAAADASIARYLAAGERMRILSDVFWKVCAALFVLVAVAWALGVLPVAVRLF